MNIIFLYPFLGKQHWLGLEMGVIRIFVAMLVISTCLNFVFIIYSLDEKKNNNTGDARILP